MAVCAVLPLLTPLLWSGLRISLAPNTVLTTVDPMFEAPLSVRSPLGVWLLLVILTWFALAYRMRQAVWWEMALITAGAGLALPRVGNAWLAGLMLVVPLARQLALLPHGPRMAIGAVCVSVAIVVGVMLRPPQLPPAAVQAIAPKTGTVYVDWRWAHALQASDRTVLTAGGLTSESKEFWLDYLRVAQGHERWAAILRTHQVSVLVLDARDRQRMAADLVRQSAEWQVAYDDGAVLVAERTVR